MANEPDAAFSKVVMFGVLLTSIGTFFEEVSDVIARNKVLKKEETIYTMGFLHMFWATIFFIVLVLFNHDAFRFSAASLPYFSIRVVLEIIQVYITLRAVVEADRSTFGFIRVITLPILLVVDLLLGYQMQTMQIVGIGLVVAAILILFMDHNFSKKGSGLVLFGAFNSAATISLYKYNITHYNSVAAEQIIMLIILIIYLLFAAYTFTKEKSYKVFGQTDFFGTIPGTRYRWRDRKLCLYICAGIHYYRCQKVISCTLGDSCW